MGGIDAKTDKGNAALLESWVLSLHSKSPATVGTYLKSVGAFTDWLVQHDLPDTAPGDLEAVTRRDCEAWFTAMGANGLAAATVRSRWVALRNLYGWMEREEIVDVSPVARVHVPRAEAPPVQLLSRDDLKRLFKACEGKTFIDRRDMALTRLLATTGLRKMEARDLQVDDVDVAKRVAFVRHGKGGKGRFVRFDAETAQALDRYKRIRAKHRLADLPNLFLSRHGRLGDNSIPYILGQRSEAAGLGRIGPHKLRHSWADIMKESGATDSDLMTLGGWSSPEVMRRYGAIRATERALSAYDDVAAFSTL